jgi:hypothetical protein
MSVIQTVKKPHRAKGGKKNRKHGRGTRKVSKSRFVSYAGLFQASKERKRLRGISRLARLARRAAKKLGW